MSFSLKINISVIISCIIAVLMSCNFSRTFKNRPKDQEGAQAIIRDFNNTLKERRYDDAVTFFSNGKGQVDIKKRNHKLKQLFTFSSNELGELKESKLLTCHTTVVEGTKPSGEYSLNYLTTYDRYIIQQSFKLALEGDSIKIVDYKNNPISKTH